MSVILCQKVDFVLSEASSFNGPKIGKVEHDL